jgi:A/G-specific adenine glycosylase
MPWRHTRVPYRILVSEVMLQQTGVERVMDRYRAFLRAFPSFHGLANADTGEILAAWKGLGYNRRAIALRESARIISTRHRGRMPRTVDELVLLPGIGRATASAVIVYSFNVPCAFIETNIRRVYLHFFLPRSSRVSDERILPLVEETMDRRNPREWFYALMDYGAMLARTVPNPNLRSAGYTRQSTFEGSLRQLRGRVLQALLELRAATRGEISRAIGGRDERLPEALRQLESEGFLRIDVGRYSFK